MSPYREIKTSPERPSAKRAVRASTMVLVMLLISLTALVLCVITFLLGLYERPIGIVSFSSSTTTILIYWFNIRSMERVKKIYGVDE